MAKVPGSVWIIGGELHYVASDGNDYLIRGRNLSNVTGNNTIFGSLWVEGTQLKFVPETPPGSFFHLAYTLPAVFVNTPAGAIPGSIWIDSNYGVLQQVHYIDQNGGHWYLQDEVSSESASISPSASESASVSPSSTPSPSPSDASPDAFSFPDTNDAEVDTVYQAASNVTPTGFDIPVTISLSTDSSFAEYSINGGGWTTIPGTLNPGDSVDVRMMSASTGDTTVTATITVGTTSGDYNITTHVI
jgi:hypothetical protein